MRVIEVVAAIIYKDGAYFATQRGYGEFEGMWEFPGCKIEPNETPEGALKREIHEELGIDIIIDNFLCTTEYDYSSFHLTMHCYLCSVKSGEIELREHKFARQLISETLDIVEQLPADKEIVYKLNNRYQSYIQSHVNNQSSPL